ncbi:MAG: TatD family hydrolase, partial [Fusobacteriaceae bacterium]
TDSHLHLDAIDEKEIQLGIKKGIVMWGTSSNYESALLNLEHKQKYKKNIKIFLGIHPENPKNFEDCEKVLKLIDEEKEEIDGIGEVGIPNFYLDRFDKKQIKSAMEILEKFIEKASQLDKVLILHIIGKDIYKVLPLLDRYKIKKAMFHWYIGEEKEIQEIEKRGYFISVNIALREDEEYRRYIATLPLKNILLETDAPYGYRKATSTLEILGLEKEVGKIFGISEEIVKNILKQNEKKLMNTSISKKNQ